MGGEAGSTGDFFWFRGWVPRNFGTVEANSPESARSECRKAGQKPAHRAGKSERKPVPDAAGEGELGGSTAFLTAIESVRIVELPSGGPAEPRVHVLREKRFQTAGKDHCIFFGNADSERCSLVFLVGGARQGAQPSRQRGGEDQDGFIASGRNDGEWEGWFRELGRGTGRRRCRTRRDGRGRRDAQKCNECDQKADRGETNVDPIHDRQSWGLWNRLGGVPWCSTIVGKLKSET